MRSPLGIVTVFVSPVSGTSAEKLSRGGCKARQFPPSTGSRKPGKSEARKLLAADVAEDPRREANSVMLVSSEVDLPRSIARAGATGFKVATGFLRSAAAFANSHGAIGYSSCHKPRRSLRAASSDRW